MDGYVLSHDEFASRHRSMDKYAHRRPQTWVERRVFDEIARLVTATRIEYGWTQARLARAAGTTTAVIGTIEAGQQRVDVELLARLANVLGITFEIAPDPA
jgi:ribosome-binding protein aMBF1 (putative translation factor)